MTIPSPVRLQLSRRKGFNLQKLSIETNGLPAKIVARPSLYGNPVEVGSQLDFSDRFNQWTDKIAASTGGRAEWIVFPFLSFVPLTITADMAVRLYRAAMGRLRSSPEAFDAFLAPLAGFNLACWCEPDRPCHADALLDFLRERAEKAGQR